MKYFVFLLLIILIGCNESQLVDEPTLPENTLPETNRVITTQNNNYDNNPSPSEDSEHSEQESAFARLITQEPPSELQLTVTITDSFNGTTIQDTVTEYFREGDFRADISRNVGVERIEFSTFFVDAHYYECFEDVCIAFPQEEQIAQEETHVPDAQETTPRKIAGVDTQCFLISGETLCYSNKGILLYHKAGAYEREVQQITYSVATSVFTLPHPALPIEELANQEE